MRALVVRPGPHFSVADVCRGWVRGLRQNGCQVVDFNLDDRLGFYHEHPKVSSVQTAAQLAAKGIESACYEVWPDVVVIVSGFFVPPAIYELIRQRRHKLVLLHTESPYEDDRQVARAAYADLNIVNDPTNIDRFREVAPTVYIPHAYDPEVHHPRPAVAEALSDLCFVGTGYQSRIDFLEACDLSGIDVALAGHWTRLAESSPLRQHLAHDVEECCPNDQAAVLYASTKASLNLYRREALRPELSAGWAMGPREVELAACGTFFLREPRGETDEVLPMLPTFDGPDDMVAQLRWWLAHDDERRAAAEAARAAVAERTFANHAAQLLRLLDL